MITYLQANVMCDGKACSNEIDLKFKDSVILALERVGWTVYLDNEYCPTCAEGAVND